MWQLDVLQDGPLGVPLRLLGVGRREDGRTGVDTDLGNKQGVLLHHLVEDGPEENGD